MRSALVNSGFDYPQHRITANLAPADLRKAGPGFDLAIAAALLVATGQLPMRVLDRYALAGELALDGAIRPVPGRSRWRRAPAAGACAAIAVASEDAGQAALVRGLEVVAVDHVTRLRELAEGGIDPVPPAEPPRPDHEELPDLADLRGTRLSPLPRDRGPARTACS